MSLYGKNIRVSAAAAILRDVYGQNTAKKIARRFGVAVITAKIWLSGRFPEARTHQLAATVREELDRIEQRNNEIRKSLGIEKEHHGGDTSATTMGRAPGEPIAESGKRFE